MFNLSLPLLLELFRRILVSALCGALIGLERDIHGRAAGLRTHTLVAIGSALFTINSVLISMPADTEQLVYSKDISRIAAQVVSGIGFLGAGTIIKTGFSVKGLTTAACLWFVAALGMACGIGLCLPAVLIALLGLLVIFSGKWLELKLHRLYPFQLLVEARSSARLEDVKGFLEQAYKLDIASLNLSVANTETATVYRATFFLDTSISLRQPDACLKLTQKLLDRFPDLLTISYKCES